MAGVAEDEVKSVVLGVFKQHHSSLCRSIGSHPNTCLLTAAELYSKDLISQEVKNDVTDRALAANIELAMKLLQCLEVKLQESPKLWEKAIEAFSTMDSLEPTVTKMKDQIRLELHSRSRKFSLDLPQLHGNCIEGMYIYLLLIFFSVAEMVHELDRRLELATQVKKLRNQFYDLIVQVKRELSDADIDEIKMILTSALSNYTLEFNGQLQEYLDGINQQNTVQDLIQYLMTKSFCGFLNYELLACVVDTLGNENSKAVLQVYKKHYEEFAKQVKLRELIRPYLNKHNLDETNIVGLPIIRFEVGDSWLHRSLFTFKCAISKVFTSAWRLVYANTDPGSIRMTFTILPEDLHNVIRDFKQNSEFLSSLGIKASIEDGIGEIMVQTAVNEAMPIADAEIQTETEEGSARLKDTISSLDKNFKMLTKLCSDFDLSHDILKSIQGDMYLLKMHTSTDSDIAASGSTISISSSTGSASLSQMFPTPSPEPLSNANSPKPSVARPHMHQVSAHTLTVPGDKEKISNNSPLLHARIRVYKSEVDAPSEDEEFTPMALPLVDSEDRLGGSGLSEQKHKKRRAAGKKTKSKKGTQ